MYFESVNTVRSKNGEARRKARLIELVQHVADGNSNEEIGKKMFLSQRTVHKYLTDVMFEFDAKNRAHLAIIFMRKGWIQ